MVHYKDYRRVIGIPDLFYFSGKFLKKKTIKYTGLAGLITVGIVATKVVGNKVFGYEIPISNASAISIPIVAAGSTLGLGSVCSLISNILSLEKILTADANSMNLMEDRKKADRKYHLETLWNRVFKYEAELRNTERETKHEANELKIHRECTINSIRRWPIELLRRYGVDPANDQDLENLVKHIESFRPLSTGMEATLEGFKESAKFALKNPLPQSVERTLIGFNLSLLEDWYDGALFNANDCKLKEQYAANNAIFAVRQKVGIPRRTKILEGLFGHPKGLFYRFTMAKTGICVGRLIDQFNKKYVDRTEAKYFDAQHFLWPHPTMDKMVKEKFGDEALKDLINSRKTMMRSIFSDDKGVAHQHIYAMYGKDFVRAMNLRLKYDIEFATDALDHNPMDDIHELQRADIYDPYFPDKANEVMCVAQEKIKIIDNYLKKEMPSLTPLQKRAARIGFYLNRFNIQEKIEGNSESAKQALKLITSAHERYSERICLLRQHYELTRLQLFLYMQMVDEMAQFNK